MRGAVRQWVVMTRFVASLVGVALLGSCASSVTGPQPGDSLSPRMQTVRMVARLLAAAPPVPGAVRVAHAPSTVLDRPASAPASAHLVRRTRWWTVSGTMAGALGYVRSHLPLGVRPSGSSNSAGNGAAVQGLFFDASGPQWQRPAVCTGLQLLVAATPYRGGVAIRVDAQAIWLPQRSPSQRIPPGVTSVRVVVNRPGSRPTMRRTLGAAEARTLAAVVNHLAVFTPGQYSCPMDRGFTDSLTFHDPHGDIRVQARVGGCTPVTVLADGRQRGPTLQGGAIIDHAVTRALGLPRTYGE